MIINNKYFNFLIIKYHSCYGIKNYAIFRSILRQSPSIKKARDVIIHTIIQIPLRKTNKTCKIIAEISRLITNNAITTQN